MGSFVARMSNVCNNSFGFIDKVHMLNDNTLEKRNMSMMFEKKETVTQSVDFFVLFIVFYWFVWKRIEKTTKEPKCNGLKELTNNNGNNQID